MPDQPKINVTAINGIPVDPEKSLLDLQMIGDRIVIDRETPSKYADEAQTILKAVDYKEPYSKGKIMSIGGGEYGSTVPSSMKVGMVVHYWHQQASPFVIGKKEYDIVRASDVFMYL